MLLAFVVLVRCGRTRPRHPKTIDNKELINLALLPLS